MASLWSSLRTLRLRDENSGARANVSHALIDVGNVPGQLLPSHGFHGHDGAILIELFAGFFIDHPLDANAPEYFHGALVDHCGARVDGSAAMVLHGKRPNAVEPEKQGSGHAHEAASDDQYRDFEVAHNPDIIYSPNRITPVR
jgi:hypothetical protein